MRSSQRRELQLGRADADYRTCPKVLLDLGAVEEGSVRALEIAHEIAFDVTHAFEVDARYGLVREREIVLGALPC